MSVIVKNIETIHQHVTINFNFDFNLMAPYVRRAERKFIKPAIGSEMYTTYIEDSIDGVERVEVQRLLEEASSNLALLAYTFVGIISISDSGFHISTAESTTPAEWWQIRDLRRALLNAGNEALDEALAVMESNPSEFPEWESSDAYTVFKEFFVRKTQDFQNWFNIENSRLTFFQLKPHLRQTEYKYFLPLLGSETAKLIKAAATGEAKEALRLCQAAQVALTISEITDEGLFLFTPQGLFTSTSEVPGEKRNSLSVAEIQHLSAKRQTVGNEYLRNLVKHLEAFPFIFTDYAEKQKAKAPQIAYAKKSILSL